MSQLTFRRRARRAAPLFLLALALLMPGIFPAAAAPAEAAVGEELVVYPPEIVPPPSAPPESYDPSYDYQAPVPASPAVEDSWFSDAVFLGDSLTEGLYLYTDLAKMGADSLAYRALNVLTITTQRVIVRDGENLTPLQALNGPTYGKIYLSLGINGLGWYRPERYYDQYAALIDAIRELQPQAHIYIQTLLPVTAARSSNGGNITNSRILQFNELIARLASEEQVYLLDPYSVFADENGVLPSSWSTDGLHLTAARYALWLDYLRTHTV